MPNNKRILLETKKIRFSDRHNKKYILGIARDVTQQEELVEELNTNNKALQQAKSDMDNLLRESDICAIFANREQKIILLTPGAKSMLQIEEVDGQQTLLTHLKSLHIPDMSESLAQAIHHGLSTEVEIQSDTGIYYHIRFRPYLLVDNVISGAVITITSIDQIKKSELLVDQNQTLIEFVAKNAGIGIWRWSIEDDCHEWNDGMKRLYFVGDDEATKLNKLFFSKIIDEDLPQVKYVIAKTLKKKGSLNIEYRIHGPNNDIRYLHLIAQYVLNSPASSAQLTGMCFDISKLKKAEKNLSKIALQDSVTRIANRAHLLDFLPRAIAKAKRRHTTLAVLFLDLDDFKNVNDTLGHPCGDKLLYQIASRIKKSLREEDFFARIGGDEFAIVLENILHLDEVATVSQRCLQSVTKEFEIDGNLILQSFSLGISIYPDSATTVDGLLQYADIAMYKAKEKGKNNFVFFRDELDQKMQRYTLIEKSLVAAVDQEQFQLVYQPQYDMTENMIGVEALIRWSHPDIPDLHPDEFIPIAERKHVIHSIGELVLERAAIDFKKVLNKISVCDDFRVAVNISSVQLMTRGFVQKVIKILSKHGVSPHFLTIEITETALISNIDKAQDVLYELHKYGIKVALDDFGKGYSSLTYLVNLPIDYLKIDKSFTQKISELKSNFMIESIVTLAKNMGIICIAEGVEKLSQFEFLKKTSCHQYQGFYFSKPLGIEKFTEEKGKI